jgi:predicted pyridoxine 5'-phosphate oxidase superfamily flavin-nucleotide-binding protein
VTDELTVSGIRGCFEGVIPATIATASRDGCPNVTHLSRVFYVDDNHVALSNQFFSKTTRNLAENPYASVLLIDPLKFDEYRLFLKYERTERRGPLFDRMEADIDAVAAITGMTGIFKLKSADIYRVVQLDREPTYS